MTREHKLALLIGFALVLVVGVVVSDHFSGARMAQIEGRVASTDPVVPPVADDPFLTRPLPVAMPPAQVHAMNDPIGRAAPDADPYAGYSDEPAIESSRTASIASTVANGIDRLEQFTIEMGDRLNGAPVAAVADMPIVQTSEGPARLLTLPETRPAPSQPRTTYADQPTAADTRRPAPAYPAPKPYNVQKNETLWSIAAKHYGDGAFHTKLAEFNKARLTPRGDLRAGATILIPTKDELLGRAPQTAASPQPQRQEPTRPTAQPEKAKPAAKPEMARTYTVKKGDTLGDIAKSQLGSAKRWSELVDLNDIDDPDHVPAGTVLKLPSR